MTASKISTFDGFETKLQKIEASYLNFDPITRVPNAKSRSQQSGFNGTLIITHHRLLWLFGSGLNTQPAAVDLDQPLFAHVVPYRQVTHALFPEGLSIPFCNIYDVTVGKSGKRHLLAPKSLYKASFLIRLFTKDCCVHIFQLGQGSSQASAVISFLKVLQARLTIRYSICELYGDADLYQQLHRRLHLSRQQSQSVNAEQQHQRHLVSNSSAPSPLERAPSPSPSPSPALSSAASPSQSPSPSEGLRASCLAAVCFGGRPSRAFARQLGWLEELKRLRCERAFRVVRLDHLCDSLPEYAVVPISLKDRDSDSRVEAALASLAPHFNQRRLPTWCYALAKRTSAASVCLASASLWVASRPERAEHQFDSPHVPAHCEHISPPSPFVNVEAGTASESATVDNRGAATQASPPPAQGPASSLLRPHNPLRVDFAANSSRMRLEDEVSELPFWENVMELFSAIEQTHLAQLSDADSASRSSTPRICVYDIVKLCPILSPCNVASAYQRLHYLITKEFSEERESRAQFRDECLGEFAGGWLDGERERRGGWCDLVGALLGLSVRVAAELLSSRSVLVLEASGRDLALALSALVELRLERSARTREGFARLVSKHLVALGHPFRTRLLGPPTAGLSASASSASSASASSTSTTSFGAPNAPKSPSPSTASSAGLSPLQLQLPLQQPTTPNSLFSFEQFDGAELVELSSRTAAGADDEQQEARSAANSRISVLSTASTATSSFGITTRAASDATCQSRSRDKKDASRTPKGLKSLMSKIKNAALTPAKLIRSAAFASTLSLPSSRKLSDSLLSIISNKPLEQKPEDSGCFTPVLLLFLDCVRQLLEDYPAAFEFTEVYLAALWESALSGLASEFAFDSIEQRREAFRASAFGHIPFEKALSMADALPPHASLSACGLKELHRPAGADGDAAAAPLDEAYQLAAHLSSAFHLPTRYRFDDERFRSELEHSHCNPLNILFDADRVPYIELLVRSSLEATPIDSFLIDPSAPHCSMPISAQDSSPCLSCSPFNDVHNELLVDATSHPLRVRVWDELFCRWIAQLWPVPSLQEPANPHLKLVAQRLCQPSRQTLADFPEHAVAAQPHMQLFTGARRAQLAALLRDAVRLAPPTPTGHMRQQWAQIDDASPSREHSQAVTPSASSERFASAADLFANRAVRVGGNASATSPANSTGSTLTPSPEQTPADVDEKPIVVKQYQRQQQSPRHVGSSIAPVIKCASKSSVSTSSGVSTVSSSARGPPAPFLPTTTGGSTACHLDSSTSDEPSQDNQNPTHNSRQGSLVRRLVSEFSRQASVPSLSKTDVDTHAAPLSRTTSSSTRSRRADHSALSTLIPKQLTRLPASQATAASAAANAATRESRQTECSQQMMGQGDGDGGGGSGSVVLRAHRDSPLHNRRPVHLPFALSNASSSCSSSKTPPNAAASVAALGREEGRRRDEARPAIRLQASSIASKTAAASDSSASDGLDGAKHIRPTPSAVVGSLLKQFSPDSTNL